MSNARAFLWPILVIGILLIITPFIISLPSKGAAGQQMLDAFHPIMQPAHVDKAATYYDETFVPLGSIASAAVAAGQETPGMLGALATKMHMTPAQLETFLGSAYPAMGGLLTALPKAAPVFSNVPAGLAYYKPLITTMSANTGNYAKVDSLPNFNLFTWFFVVPGALLVILAGLPLLGSLRKRGRATTA